MSSLRMSLENQVQNLLNNHITNFVEIISKEYKIPKEVIFITELPKNALGKIKVSEVKKIVNEKDF